MNGGWETEKEKTSQNGKEEEEEEASFTWLAYQSAANVSATVWCYETLVLRVVYQSTIPAEA